MAYCRAPAETESKVGSEATLVLLRCPYLVKYSIFIIDFYMNIDRGDSEVQFGVLKSDDPSVSASESRFLLCLFSGTFRAVESVARLLQHTFNSRFKTLSLVLWQHCFRPEQFRFHHAT